MPTNKTNSVTKTLPTKAAVSKPKAAEAPRPGASPAIKFEADYGRSKVKITGTVPNAKRAEKHMKDFGFKPSSKTNKTTRGGAISLIELKYEGADAVAAIMKFEP